MAIDHTQQIASQLAKEAQLAREAYNNIKNAQNIEEFNSAVDIWLLYLTRMQQYSKMLFDYAKGQEYGLPFYP